MADLSDAEQQLKSLRSTLATSPEEKSQPPFRRRLVTAGAEWLPWINIIWLILVSLGIIQVGLRLDRVVDEQRAQRQQAAAESAKTREALLQIAAGRSSASAQPQHVQETAVEHTPKPQEPSPAKKDQQPGAADEAKKGADEETQRLLSCIKLMAQRVGNERMTPARQKEAANPALGGYTAQLLWADLYIALKETTHRVTLDLKPTELEKLKEDPLYSSLNSVASKKLTQETRRAFASSCPIQ